jgi:hypothetical protein
MAISGSSVSQPVMKTSATPAITAAEVQTSVSKCRPSASSVMLSCSRPTRSSIIATPKLMAEATTVSARPASGMSSSRGAISRGMAVQTMPAAASTISAPSMPAEKYSALEKP